MNEITKDNQNGFTLIEIMIAMLVLSIGILGLAKMQLTAVKVNSYASGLTEATTFAQNKMEELMTLAYDDPDLDDETPNPDKSQQNIGATNIGYTVLWNVAVNNPAANAKHVRVYVQWSQKGVLKTVVLNRIKANI